MDKKDKQTGLIEAILFLENEPRSKDFLSKASGMSGEEVQAALDALGETYRRKEHGLELILVAGGYFFTPKQELLEYLKPRYGKHHDAGLSKAALETLAIIAYSQPVTRAEIESIRGVSADAMIKLLQTRNLIKEVGKKEVPGRPVQFGTTKEFLLYFKLGSIAELPKLDEVETERFRLR
ncbi:MAG: SMC-Scp complex subunit ScpB [Spirochaetales bacterium]|nr:SMC-Scp complex subunit ScpB [Spirochaetales bacterium]